MKILLIEGKWKIIFNYDKVKATESEMIISQNKNKIQGTFRTETGVWIHERFR